MLAREASTAVMKSLRAQERSLHTAYARNQKQTEVKMETSGGKPKGSQWQLNSSQRITARPKNIDRQGAKQASRGLTT